MLPGNDTFICKGKREAKRYQPSFDLRKNLARIIAQYSMSAVNKGILLDIFVAQETPNYFQGDLTCLLEMLSELLKHGIETSRAGEISLRIYHESLHKNNNSETELSITVTTNKAAADKNRSGSDQYPATSGPEKKETTLNNFTSVQRIKHLCSNFAGNFSMQKLTEKKMQYQVTFVLQQAHPVRMFHLV